MSWIISYLAFDECGSDMKRMVDWDDEENGEREPVEEAGETDVSDDEHSNDEEPRIKHVLENLSKTVSRERASDLLHSMAASRDILIWIPRGQLLRKNRIIPVANIAELVEYILLPHNDEVIKPRALYTSLDGLAELGVDKRLKILSDLLEKEKVYRENEGKGDDDSDRSDSSDGEESQSESNDAETVSESDRESIIQRESSKPCHHCQNWNMSVTAVVKCPRCFGTITILFVPFVITTSRLTTNI